MASENRANDDRLSDETLTFIYEHIKDAPERQAQDWRDLDSKLIQVFGAASVVLGLGGLAGAQHHSLAGTLLLLLALAAFALVAAAAFIQLRPQQFAYGRFGDTLWPNSWMDSPSIIRHGIVEVITEASATNKRVFADKATALKVVLAATSAEVALVIGAVLVDRLL